MLPKQLRLPPSAEFLARCGYVARQRFGKRQAPTTSPDLQLRREPVTPEQLASALSALGIKPGGDVIVHSDAPAMESIGWTPSDMIDFLVDYIGTDGTLLMPTHPKLKTVDGKRTFNLRRSPSTVGMMTELFRRRPGVVRSSFPYSSVAAFGARANELLDDHINSFAPHDEHSPYAKLATTDGKALCIGCDLDRMTILHVAEDTLRDQLEIDGFHQPQTVHVIDGDEERLVVAHTRAPWLWWYLNLSRWTSDMYRHRVAKDVSVNGVPLRAASAGRMSSFMDYEIKSGRSLYPLAKINRWLKLDTPQLEAA